MNGGASLFALFFLLVVNLSFFTEVDSIVLRPGIGQPRRSVPFHEFRAKRIVGHHYPSRAGRSVLDQDRAKRHATGMDSIIAPPEKMRLARGDGTYKPPPSRFGRSVPDHEVIAKRHATAMDSIIAPPEKMRLARADFDAFFKTAAKLNEGKGRPGRSVGFNSRFVRDFNDFMKTIAKVRPGRSVEFNSRFERGDDFYFYYSNSVVLV